MEVIKAYMVNLVLFYLMLNFLLRTIDKTRWCKTITIQTETEIKNQRQYIKKLFRQSILWTSSMDCRKNQKQKKNLKNTKFLKGRVVSTNKKN